MLRTWRFVTLMLVALGFAPELGSAVKLVASAAALVLIGLVLRRRVLGLCVLGALLLATGAAITWAQPGSTAGFLLWAGGAALLVASVVDETPAERRRPPVRRSYVPDRAPVEPPGPHLTPRAPNEPSVTA